MAQSDALAASLPTAEVEYINVRLRGERDYNDARFEAITAQLTEAISVTNERIHETVRTRDEALKQAANTIQVGLDKAERQLQTSLEKAQGELRLALTDAEKRVNEKLEAKDQALSIATQTLNQRLDEFNKFKDQIGSERALYVSRDQLAAVEKSIREQLEIILRSIGGELKPLQHKQSYESGVAWAVGAFVGVLGTLIPLIIYWFTVKQ